MSDNDLTMTVQEIAARERELHTRLIEQAYAGDRGAQRQLYEAIAPRIEQSVSRVVASYRGRLGGRCVPEETEEICQEVHLVIHQRGALLAWKPEIAPLMVLVWTIARNVALDWFRKKRLPVMGDTYPDDVVDLGPHAECLYAGRETTARLSHALRAVLSDTQWQIIEYHCVFDLGVGEIARLLECGENAVAAKLSRIRRSKGTLIAHIMLEMLGDSVSPAQRDLLVGVKNGTGTARVKSRGEKPSPQEDAAPESDSNVTLLSNGADEAETQESPRPSGVHASAEDDTSKAQEG